MTPATRDALPTAYSAKSLRALCLELTRDTFERQHPHPWLSLGLDSEESEDVAVHTLAGPGALGGGGLRAVLSLRSEGLCFLALRKRAGSSQALDTVTVGRSRDNDLILQHSSISKVHARFILKDGEWWLADADSRNGTLMNFRPVPSEEGVPLRDRAILKFGGLSCTVLLRSGELYDAMVGKGAR